MSTNSQENQVSASVQELQGPADQDQVLIPEETEVWYITAGEKVRRQFRNHIRQRIGELQKENKGEARAQALFSVIKANQRLSTKEEEERRQKEEEEIKRAVASITPTEEEQEFDQDGQPIFLNGHGQ